jgi:hypothetical protein
MGEQRMKLVVFWLHSRKCYPAVRRKVERLFHEQNARTLLTWLSLSDHPQMREKLSLTSSRTGVLSVK